MQAVKTTKGVVEEEFDCALYADPVNIKVPLPELKPYRYLGALLYDHALATVKCTRSAGRSMSIGKKKEQEEVSCECEIVGLSRGFNPKETVQQLDQDFKG